MNVTRTTQSRLEKIRTTKQRLGPINIIDIGSETLPEIHRALGEHVRTVVPSVLSDKIDRIKSDVTLGRQIRQIKSCYEFIEMKIRDDSLPTDLRTSLALYLDCLTEWAKGAGIDSYAHSRLQKLQDEGITTSTGELALWLQNDNGGCQTGMMRLPDRNIVFWHTEEDLSPYVTNASFVRYRWNGDTLTSFLYPYLLPGGTFSWSGKGVRMIDSIPVEDPNQSGFLANTICWIQLHIGDTYTPEAIIKFLTPVIDGYSLNIVSRERDVPQGQSLEFGGDEYVKATLKEEAGDYLVRVNIVSQDNSALAKKYQSIAQTTKVFYERRRIRTEGYLQEFIRGGYENPLGFVKRFLCSCRWGSYDFANQDVKAHMVGIISPESVSVTVESGPATDGESGQTFLLR